jgi:hypothetical protein
MNFARHASRLFSDCCCYRTGPWDSSVLDGNLPRHRARNELAIRWRRFVLVVISASSTDLRRPTHARSPSSLPMRVPSVTVSRTRGFAQHDV